MTDNEIILCIVIAFSISIFIYFIVYTISKYISKRKENNRYLELHKFDVDVINTMSKKIYELEQRLIYLELIHQPEDDNLREVLDNMKKSGK